MHIVYAVTACSDQVYRQLFSGSAVKPALQSQKYHRLLIEGLTASTHVDVIANPPVNASLMDRRIVRLPKEQSGDATYHNIPAIRNRFIKLACVAAGTFFQTLKYAKKDSVVIVDCLNCTTAFFAQLAAKLRRIRCLGIVTDLPDMLPQGEFTKRFSNFVIGQCTDYILLTEAMNERLNPNKKPYVILEGHSDIAMKERIPSQEKKTKPRICMYAGCISKQYGLDKLVEGFQNANIPNLQLHLYGPCDYDEELKAISEADERIRYGGTLLNSEIVEKELEATLLVNPRPTHKEFVKYSFPSKTMEYMASGTPVLTTVLPGMPKEYHPYVYLLEEETAEGIAKQLQEIFSQSDEALFEKGMAARTFILETRNNVVQAKKILDMLEK